MTQLSRLTPSADAVATAVERLERASRDRQTCLPVSDLIGGTDIGVAYRVQSALTQRRLDAGATAVGRKIGLTSAAIQAQVGVDRPDFGVLFDDMRYADGETIPYARLLQARAEAEIAFLLGDDITDPDPAVVRKAVELAHPALEIVDSRIAGWRIGITDTVADNASSGVFVVGTQGKTLKEFEPADVRMTMWQDGTVVSRGTGRDCLGDPVNALVWLATTAIEIGSPLRAGEVVLSGALGPMVEVRPGDVFEAAIAPLGAVTARFSGKDDE
ncbi:2-keto-4-pentenoate hydratase [Fodinicola acaciae]|uniref:2-keto-4-pentenoate hydratase n=1 Tax=Fodinicola acaciae TaxID=2681555 RepID=UPI0013D4DAC6|nr:fumarylacetoacetate hydrolase family protein [Fodinicola acaciae]